MANDTRVPPPDLPPSPPLEKPRDHCGGFAVFGHPDATVLTYYGLYALQHRGQESAGIVATVGDGGPLQRHVGMGLVSQVFNDSILKSLKGTRAIGHTRYYTTGASELKNAQPILVDCSRGQIAMAHNGNIVNANILRDQLEANGSIFQTSVDSEVILHLLAKPRSEDRDSNLCKTMGQVRGAYSLVILGEREIIGIRDPHAPEKLLAAIEITNGIVASSGDYERYFIRNGKRYHHILDPRTGYPTQGLHGVTLVADTLEQVNGLGAAIMVLGAAPGKELIAQTPGLAGLLVDREGELWVSPGLEKRLRFFEQPGDSVQKLRNN